MANIIEKVNVGGTVYNIASTAYAVSSQAANEPAKTINIDGFALETGVTIHVKFANANTASNPTLTVSGTGSSGNSAVPIIGHTTWEAGAVFTLTYDGTNWVQDYDKIIENTITGSGTSGYLAKFNGTNSITNGPQLGNAVTNQTQDTLFLRSDGTWAKPSYTTNSDEKVKQTGITTDEAYPILLKNTTGTSDVTAAAVNFGKTTNKVVTINPSTGAITAPGGLVGNASTATKFSSARSIALSGDVSGSASSDGESGWSITTTIGEGKVTNVMLAGSIANDKLSNSKVTIAGQDVSLGSSIDAATLRTKLGLTQALRFVGTTSTTMSDGYTGTPAGISIYSGTGAVTPSVGDVVLDSSSNAEYACVSVSGTTYTWELLGRDSSWALDDSVIHNSLLTTKGDMIYRDTSGPQRLAIGTGNNKFLTISNGVPAWGTVGKSDVGLGNVTNYAQIEKRLGTTKGDIIYFSGDSAPERLAISSTTGQVLTVTSGGIPGWATPTVDWSNVTNKVLAALYVNATATGAANDTAATTNSDTYLHLYDNSTKQSTIQLIGAGGTSISSTASSKNITITSKKYKSTGSINALTSLTLTYNNGTAQTNDVSSTAVAIGSVENAVLYIKSIKYGTTSVSTGVSEDNT